jgi:PEP-CTERM motif-containing protein
MSKRHSFLAVTLVATCAFALSSPTAFALTTVFSDTFNSGSTLNAAPTTPTSTSASYEFGVGATVTGTADSINPGDLSLDLGNTASILGEIEAQFAASPITLANVGDFIDLQVTWVATSNVFSGISGPNTQVDMGLYNSGSSAPQQGSMVFNSTSSPTGGAKSWEGYAGSIFQGANSKVYARPKQTSATSAQNQELLFNAASSSQAYNSPQGGQLTSASKASTISESAGSTNTSEFKITLTGVNSLAVSNLLYAGAGTGGSILFFEQGTTNNVTDFSFDALAFGYRSVVVAGNSASNSAVDVQSITVTTNTVPEPSTVMLVGAGFAMMLGLIRRRRS